MWRYIKCALPTASYTIIYGRGGSSIWNKLFPQCHHCHLWFYAEKLLLLLLRAICSSVATSFPEGGVRPQLSVCGYVVLVRNIEKIALISLVVEPHIMTSEEFSRVTYHALCSNCEASTTGVTTTDVMLSLSKIFYTKTQFSQTIGLVPERFCNESIAWGDLQTFAKNYVGKQPKWRMTSNKRRSINPAILLASHNIISWFGDRKTVLHVTSTRYTSVWCL